MNKLKKSEFRMVGEHGLWCMTPFYEKILIENLYGDDLVWLENGKLAGLPAKDYVPSPNRNLRNQRGLRFM